jgi:hypothetical protein
MPASRWIISDSFRLTLFRFHFTFDALDLTPPAGRDFDRKLRRFFDGGFDTARRLFGLCFYIDRFGKEAQLFVGGFLFIQGQSKKFAASFSPSSFAKVCTVPYPAVS